MRNGQFRSLIVRATADTLVVLAGTRTLQALLAHGPGLCGLITTVDGEELCGGQEWEPVARCEIVTCDDATAPRINLVDNRSAEIGHDGGSGPVSARRRSVAHATRSGR
ncbi:hypothetical protein NHG22_03890 [Streptomyces sp. ATE26]|uniref:hypothetical protein n=1 Tax=Streptomyces sp. ATE26 TaxID=2954237 RepID=UPI00248292D0|nr:hypothetical protein [Streptomyces sp. ATE26]MDI1452966.1 hypothetical protein [Streptomyces sp. ATE26]